MSKFTPHTVSTKKRKIRIINSPQKLKTYPVAAAAAVAAAWTRCSVHLGGHSPAACWAVDEFQNWTVFYVGDEQDKKCIRMWNSQLNLVRGKKTAFWNCTFLESWKLENVFLHIPSNQRHATPQAGHAPNRKARDGVQHQDYREWHHEHYHRVNVVENYHLGLEQKWKRKPKFIFKCWRRRI